MSFGVHSEEHLKLINQYLDSSLAEFADSVSQQFSGLIEAMEYSLEGSAKRLRPTLVLASAEFLGLDPRSVLPAASAIEFIHTYSLIHDDLPAMDDDDLRRGKPSSHKKFGEATAILAGDALLTEAFGQLLRAREDNHFEPKNVLSALQLLVQHSGVGGMVGGQFLDVTVSEEAMSIIPQLEFIHIHKTGALIKISTLLPAFLCGATEEKKNQLRHYGEALGLAFQISDDLLDSETNSRYSRGPRKKPRPSYTQLMSPTEARDRLNGLIETAIESVDGQSTQAKTLIEIAKFIRTRKY